jgi:DNA-binding beta-propeller fold protein YncE
VSDGTDLYVADTGNHTIRKIVISTGAVTTFAGTAGISGSADGTGTAARFNSPYGITIDATGTNLYIADTNNHTIRQIVIATGEVSTLAGSAGSPGFLNGTGSAARFRSPSGITIDGTGTNLYVADTYNHAIRQIVISTRAVTIFAGTGGSGSVDAAGTTASFYLPSSITRDGANLYVADTFNSTIRKIVLSTKVVSTLAGSAGNPGSTDGTGATARFNFPRGVASDGTNLYVADTYNSTIRNIDIATGTVTTLAGLAGTPGSADATGTGSTARFYNPAGISFYGTTLYVPDTNNHAIRQIGM